MKINSQIRAIQKECKKSNNIYLMLKPGKTDIEFDIKCQSSKPNSNYFLVTQNLQNKFAIFNYINYNTPVFYKII